VDRRFLRPGWIAGHVLVFLAVLTCLRLGWWQWERTQETTGTAQNFGYALLWPAFGAAFVFMWVRFLHLEVVKDVEDDEQTDRDLRELLEAEAVVHPDPEPAGGTESETDQSTESEPPLERTRTADSEESDDPPPRLLRRRPDLQRPSQGVTISVAMVGEDDDDDPELTAYNQALAALAEEDRRRAR
jgi:DNA-binding transcriptional regulator of glucitol operon